MVVLHVQTGREVAITNILNAISIPAIAPRQIAHERRGGVITTLAKLLFPGYIFIDCHIDDKKYYKAIEIDGTIKFLNKCQVLPPDEVQYIRDIDIGYNDEICDVAIVDGGLKILNGWLLKYNGKVVSYNRRQGRIYLEFKIHGDPVKVTCSVNFTSQAQANVG